MSFSYSKHDKKEVRAGIHKINTMLIVTLLEKKIVVGEIGESHASPKNNELLSKVFIRKLTTKHQVVRI